MKTTNRQDLLTGRCRWHGVLLAAILIGLTQLAMADTTLVYPNARIVFRAAPPDSADYDCLAFVTMGYAHGIEVGAEGTFYQLDPEHAASDSATLEVISVDPYLSVCRARGLSMTDPIRSSRIAFRIDKATPENLLAMGDSSFAHGDYERAFHFYESLPGSFLPPTGHPLCERMQICVDQLDAAQIGPLSSETQQSYEKKVDLYRGLAQHYLMYGELDAASEYLYRVLRVKPDDEKALLMFATMDSAGAFDALFRERWDREHCKPAPDPEEFPDVSGEVYPEMTYQASPSYPLYERVHGLEGSVHVLVLVDKAGKVRLATVQRGSGYLGLDEAATQAAYKCEFTPGIQFGKPVYCWVSFRYDFQMR